MIFKNVDVYHFKFICEAKFDFVFLVRNFIFMVKSHILSELKLFSVM
jgi:hypothetical protein